MTRLTADYVALARGAHHTAMMYSRMTDEAEWGVMTSAKNSTQADYWRGVAKEAMISARRFEQDKPQHLVGEHHETF